jgi:methyl-accepting chemotaxis protein
MPSIRFSIRSKLQLIFGGVMSLLLGLIVAVVYLQVAPVMRGLIVTNAQETAGRYAATINAKVGEVVVTARTLAQILANVDKDKPQTRRQTVSRFLRSVLTQNSDYASVWTTWQPDAVDGLDEQFKNTSLGNDTGRFDQTWYRASNDEIKLLVEKEADIVDSAYFNTAIKDNLETVIGPYTYSYADGAQPLLETSIVMPIRDENLRVLGVVGIDTSQALFQRSVLAIKPFNTGFAALYAKDGLIAGHANSEYIGKKVEDEAPLFKGADFDDYLAAVKGGKDTTLTLSREGKSFFVAVKPFRIGATYTNWTLALFIPEAVALAKLDAMIRVLGIAICLSFVGILILVILASRLISTPIKKVSAALKDIAEGEGDLSVRLPVAATDETGELADHFNIFISKLEATVARLKNVSRGGSAVGSELAANSEETSATAEELAATVHSLQSKITTLDESIRRVGEAVDGISRSIEDVGGFVGRQTEAVSATAASSDAIIAALAAMAKTAEARGRDTDNLAAHAKEGEAVVGRVLEATKEIGGYAASIAEMAAVINDVSERTNLLAMNAAIEAAHAGDRGRGFAVVAGEIRKLAETTRKNAATISEQLRTVTAKIDETASGAERAGKSIHAMTEGMTAAAASFREVLSDVRGLGAKGGEVSSRLDTLVASTEELSSASSDIDARARVIREEVSTIERLSSENTAGFTEMAAGIGEMRTAAETLSRLGIDNSHNTSVMDEELGKFKIAAAPEGAAAEPARDRNS